MNRPSELRRCLESIGRSTLKPYEIIVSDDSQGKKAEETKGIVLGFENVRYSRGPRKGLSANRNNCLRYTGGEFVVFIDDDAEMNQDFLDNILTVFQSVSSQHGTDRIIVTGKEINNGKESVPLNLSFLGFYEKLNRPSERQQTICMNSTLFPSKLFRRVKFDENIFYGTEERDISLNAAYLGFKIVYCPEAFNFHYPSHINRSAYEEHIETSRFYFGLKRYWLYERCIPKFLLFALYAPANCLGGQMLRLHLGRLPAMVHFYLRAWKLFLFFLNNRKPR